MSYLEGSSAAPDTAAAMVTPSSSKVMVCSGNMYCNGSYKRFWHDLRKDCCSGYRPIASRVFHSVLANTVDVGTAVDVVAPNHELRLLVAPLGRVHVSA